MRLPEKVELSLAVPAQRVAPEQERRATDKAAATKAAAVPGAAPAEPSEKGGTRPVWSLRAIFRNHPFPPVPGIRASSLSQDEEAPR